MDATSEIKAFEHQGDYRRAAASYNALLQQPRDLENVALNAGLLSALQNEGQYHILDLYLRKSLPATCF
jgi:hypothetical protein